MEGNLDARAFIRGKLTGYAWRLTAVMSSVVGMYPPGVGLAVHQLLKMKAKGLIDLATFLQLTAEVEGFVEERPVELDGDSDKGTPAPAAAEPERGSSGGGSSGEGVRSDDEGDEEEIGDEAESEEEEEELVAPAAKKQKLSGDLRSFMTRPTRCPTATAKTRRRRGGGRSRKWWSRRRRRSHRLQTRASSPATCCVS